tara:strand:- start:58647 stop:59084 length:438 start_codon:yes stop_codon:yes gene_type:complete
MKLTEAIKVLETHLELPELGPNDEGHYELVFDDILNISLVPMREGTAFGVLGEIAQVPEGEDEAEILLKKLLHWNLLGAKQAEGGLFFDREKGMILLQYCFAEPSLASDDFLDKLESFLANLESWCQRLKDSPPQPPSSPFLLFP